MTIKKSFPSDLPARERLLETAHRLFYAEGIRATGIDTIISEANVTKTTFYRHFPSKNSLILAYLECRHHRWITWFEEHLNIEKDKHTIQESLLLTLQKWFYSSEFYGCAFINATSELGEALPAVKEISYRHKKDMIEVLSKFFHTTKLAGKEDIIALAIDGAIVKAQMSPQKNDCLHTLAIFLKELA